MFLNTLLIWTFSKSNVNPDMQGSMQDKQHNTVLILCLEHMPDLYMLCYQICHLNNDYVILKDRGTGKEYLKSLQFADKKHIGFLRKVATGQADVSEANILAQTRWANENYRW